MDRKRFFSTLASLASFFAFAVIGLGAYTRLIDAGLGCPDWPLCYGHWALPLSNHVSSIAEHYPGLTVDFYKAWAEMIHRYFAGMLSFIIVSLFLVLIFTKVLRKRENIIGAIALFVLLIYQIILGQWTVTLKLLPIVVIQHLLGGFFILSVLWLLYLNNSINKVAPVVFLKKRRSLILMSVVAIVLLFFQITLGAWTSTNYASLSCPDFPMCIQGQFFSFENVADAFALSPKGLNYEGGILSQEVRQTIQMMHRLGALILLLYMLFFTWIASPLIKNQIILMKSLYVIWGLLSFQICIGIINIIYQLPLLTAILHNLVAALLLLSMLTWVVKLCVSTKKVAE